MVCQRSQTVPHSTNCLTDEVVQQINKKTTNFQETNWGKVSSVNVWCKSVRKESDEGVNVDFAVRKGSGVQHHGQHKPLHCSRVRK